MNREDDGGDANRWRGPLPGESLDGYLAYRAARAFMPGPFAIAALGGAIHPHYPEIAYGGGDLPDGLVEVAAALEVDVETLRAMAHPITSPGRRAIGTTDIDLRLLQTRTRRFSPAALRLSPHHRTLWRVRCLPFDEEAWEALVDRCPAPYCGAVQRWRRANGVDRCDHCGGSLLDAPSDGIAEEHRDGLRLLCGLVHHDPTRVAESLAELSPVFATLPPGAVLDGACAIAGFRDPGIRGHTAARPATSVPAVRIVAAMAWAGTALRDWPRAGELLAGERLSARTGRFGDGNEGATIDLVALARRSAGGRGAALAGAALEEALRGNRARGLPIKEAVAGTGLTVRGIAARRRDGAIPTILHLQGRGRILPLLDRLAIDALRRGRGAGPSLLNVATALGITCNGVEHMLLIGLLRPADDGAAPPYAPSARIDQGSVDRLASRLTGGSCDELAEELISLHDLGRATGGGLRPWATWVEALLHAIPYRLDTGTGPLSRRLMLPVHAVEGLRSVIVEEAPYPDEFFPMMSRADAASTLCIHPRRHDAVFGRRRAGEPAGPTVALAEIRLLAATTMSAVELGALTDASPNAAYKLAVRAGVPLGPAGFERSEALAHVAASTGARRASATPV